MRLRRYAFAGFAAVLLAGCGLEGEEPRELTDREIQSGSRLDTPSTIGDLFDFGGGDEDRPGERMEVNRYLWQASLDTLEFLPLASTDPFSGVIATDWSVSPSAPSERYKVAVRITSPKLEANSLTVAVYREQRRDDTWIPVEVSDSTPLRIEDAILTRARQLRIADLEANG